MDLHIIRVNLVAGAPEWGVLLINGQPSFVTMELPWKDNHPETSCIPTGLYVAKKRPAQAKITNGNKLAFEVMNVEGRSGILIHVANIPSDIKGCIGIGMMYGVLGNEPAILQSRPAFDRFMTTTALVDTCSLLITHA